MRIDLVALCDAALEVNGRLHLLGSIDYFWSAKLPYTHPACTLAARLRWEGHERQKQHKLRVQILDGDGYSIATEFVQKFAPPVSENDDVPAVRHLILQLASLRFANYGPYAIRVEVDGNELAVLPFSLVPPNRRRQARPV